jgi:hydroxylamine dehydrogenase
MTFKSVFISVVLGSCLILAALILNSRRPLIDVSGVSAESIRATGKCAECHARETSAVVHQYERSRHAESGVSCLDCHQPAEGQQQTEHRGFIIAAKPTSKNCAQCHTTEVEQFMRSRHAAPAWAAVRGRDAFTEQQLAYGERFHPGAVDRPANVLAIREGEGVFAMGCDSCHSIGRPNPDGSIGTCTQCHARHSTSIALARTPETCGQCHMGPDHSQIEIYNESKHGVLFHAQQRDFNLDADPKSLTTRDMSVPTCATCHMSGLQGLKVTHDVTERLSWWLFAPVSEKRPDYTRGQVEMQEVCLKCHASSEVTRFYSEAEEVVQATNEKVADMQKLMADLRAEGLLSPEPFDEPIEFMEFDFWHYFGRTAKHGAFMGGADFVQWHGNYELLLMKIEMEEVAAALRAGN